MSERQTMYEIPRVGIRKTKLLKPNSISRSYLTFELILKLINLMLIDRDDKYANDEGNFCNLFN